MNNQIKYIRTIFLVVPLLLLVSTSCNRNKICTQEFCLIYINIKDSLGKAVILDSNYTEIINTNERIIEKTDSLDKINGSYLFFTDSQKEIIPENKETELKFIGIIGFVRVIDEKYILTQDGCHIKLLSGKTNIILNK
jgi:ABC-type Fe3+-hydroxamate transport system substrate-binding protein